MLASVRAVSLACAETHRLRRLRRARVNGTERERPPSAAIAAIVTIGTMSSADGTASGLTPSVVEKGANCGVARCSGRTGERRRRARSRNRRVRARAARLGADHRYVPLLLTVPGISWVLAYTIAAEIGDIPTHACTHPVYRDRYQQTKTRIGKQRGAKVAQIDLARRPTKAIWHMLNRGETFAPTGATDPLAA
jgi:hypothetical protein